MTMLEYAKLVLKKVAFDKNLFMKEYQKFIRLLPESDVDELDKWRQLNFSIAS